MKHIVLSSATALIVGLFVAGLAMGAGQQEYGQSQENGVKTPGELGVGTASGESPQVQREHQKLAIENLNKKQVREMQKLLNDQGYNVGSVDGIIGPKTQQGLRQFQESQGIAATGKPDEETLRALAPSAKEQEFFGLSPKFGGEQMGPQPMGPSKGSK